MNSLIAKLNYLQVTGPHIEAKHLGRRLIQIFWVMEASLIAFFLLLAFKYKDGTPPFEVAALCIALTPVYWLAKHRKLKSAATLLFWMMMLASSWQVWSYAGHQDAALLIVPILVFTSAMVGGFWLSLCLLIYAIGTVILVGISNDAGWIATPVATSSIRSAASLSIILISVGFFSWIFVTEFRFLWFKLTKENERLTLARKKILSMGHHDTLTGLPCRGLARMAYVSAQMLNEGKPTRVCLLLLDLDNFKAVNSTLDHRSGDEYLRILSLRIQNTVDRSGTVCHHGGDKYLVVLDSVNTSEEVAFFVEKIMRETVRPVAQNGTVLRSTVSIGVSIDAEDGTSFESICKQADIALGNAKKVGKDGYQFYSGDANNCTAVRTGLLSDMQSAVRRGQYELHFQPKIDLQNGKIIGSEALVRWRHPQHGLLAPVEFINLAESSGHIVELTEWVLEESCKQCQSWRLSGHGDLNVAVNISAIHLKRGGLPSLVQRVLLESGLPAENLELELTETVLIDDVGAVSETLEEIRAIGVKLAIDDFGTGYSSLQYLQILNVSTLKIDRCFIRNLISSTQDRSIVTAIVQMAHGLGLKSVAEGVECAEVEFMLKELGCDMAQGYLWSRPVTAAEFLVLLNNENPRIKTAPMVA